MSPETPDEPSRPKKPQGSPPPDSENPYAAPSKYDGRGGLSKPPSTWDTVWRSLGIGVVVVLLFVVVGFGLLVGCCAIGGF
jgi:hypothetical protein